MRLFYAWEPTEAVGYEEERRAVRVLRARLLAEAGIAEPQEAVGENGRPYFAEHPELDFSLTHTRGLVACALAVGKDDERPRVGIDAEPIPTDAAHAKRLAARFFAPHERRCVETSANPCRTFAEIFTAKEAFAKYTGEGLARHLGSTDTAAPDFETAQGVTLCRFAADGYAITLCTKRTTL